MGERRGRFGGWVPLIVAFVALGCGDEAGQSAEPGQAPGEERPYPNIKGPGREFIIPGGDNGVQTFGEEASAAERERASRVVHAWMKARVSEDWATDCRYFAQEYVEELVKDAARVSEGKVKNCRQALDFFGDAASGRSGNTLTGPIDSLRVRDAVEGSTEKEGVAQWHGPETDWVLPLRRERGAWRVAIAAPLDRNK